MKKIIIAIDGYSSCGKSTLGRDLAARLGYSFIDSGAMYRAVALYFSRHHIALDNDSQIDEALKHIHIEFRYNASLGSSETYLNGENAEPEIRSLGVADKASRVSAISKVRRFLVFQQQQNGRNGGLIMDGRDIGTVVFPKAELKIFITAELDIRVKRRMDELVAKNIHCTKEEVMQNLLERDHNDATRKDSPLKKADDAIVIDTSFLSPEEQVDKALQLALSVIHPAHEQ